MSGGITGPLPEHVETIKNFDTLFLPILLAVLATAIVIALIVILVVGNKKKTWVRHDNLKCLVIAGIVIFAMIAALLAGLTIIYALG